MVHHTQGMSVWCPQGQTRHSGRAGPPPLPSLDRLCTDPTWQRTVPLGVKQAREATESCSFQSLRRWLLELNSSLSLGGVVLPGL